MKQKHDRRRVVGSRLFQQMDPAAFDVDEPPRSGETTGRPTRRTPRCKHRQRRPRRQQTKKSRRSGSCGGRAPAGDERLCYVENRRTGSVRRLADMRGECARTKSLHGTDLRASLRYRGLRHRAHAFDRLAHLRHEGVDGQRLLERLVGALVVAVAAQDDAESGKRAEMPGSSASISCKSFMALDVSPIMKKIVARLFQPSAQPGCSVTTRSSSSMASGWSPPC